MPQFNLWTELVMSSPRDIFVDDDSRRQLDVQLKNTTKFPEERIAEIIQFSMPPDMPDFDLTLSNRFADRFRGACYPYGCPLRLQNPHKPLIIARVNGDESQFPIWLDRGDRKKSPRPTEKDATSTIRKTVAIRRRGYISTWLRNPEECLVYVLAHELRHLWQRDYKNKWVFGAKGKKASEKDADAYAIWKVRLWRRWHAIYEEEAALERAGAFLSSKLAYLSMFILRRCLN